MSSDVVRQRPTRRQVEVLRAYMAVGSIAAAANELGIAESTSRHSSPACTAAQAV